MIRVVCIAERWDAVEKGGGDRTPFPCRSARSHNGRDRLELCGEPARSDRCADGERPHSSFTALPARRRTGRRKLFRWARHARRPGVISTIRAVVEVFTSSRMGIGERRATDSARGTVAGEARPLDRCEDQSLIEYTGHDVTLEASAGASSRFSSQFAALQRRGDARGIVRRGLPGIRLRRGRNASRYVARSCGEV